MAFVVSNMKQHDNFMASKQLHKPGFKVARNTLDFPTLSKGLRATLILLWFTLDVLRQHHHVS